MKTELRSLGGSCANQFSSTLSMSPCCPAPAPHGASEDPEESSQQLHLVDGEGRANDQVEASFPKRSRRCMGTPPWVGVATLALLLVG